MNREMAGVRGSNLSALMATFLAQEEP